MAPTSRSRHRFGAGRRSAGNNSGSGCTQWRCMLALLAVAGAIYGGLWVSITRDLATPANEADGPLSALAHSLAVHLTPVSSLDSTEEIHSPLQNGAETAPPMQSELTNERSSSSAGDVTGSRNEHQPSRVDNSVSSSRSSGSSPEKLVAPQTAAPVAKVKSFPQEDDIVREKREQEARDAADHAARLAAVAEQKRLTPEQAAQADQAATAAAVEAAYAAAGDAAMGNGRTPGGTTYAKASSPGVAAAAAAAAGGAGKSLGVRSDGRMNVLMMVADDMRSQSMVYGKADTYTPSLARLAARGVVFDRAYAQVTVCNPSRNSFLTGRVPDVTQVWNFERTVGAEMVTLPTYFRGQGYLVLGAGKLWHWAPGPGASWSEDVAAMWPDSKVYQTMIRHERALQNATVTPMDLPPDDFMDAQIANRASKLLKMLASGDKEPDARPKMVPPYQPYVAPDRAKEADLVKAGKSILDARAPFLLAVGFHLPHEPYLFPSKVWKQYEDTELPLLRGRVARRPFGMPNYALGDVQAPFSYFQKPHGKGRGESHGQTYGPHLLTKPELSPLTNFMKEHPYPDPMRRELLKGYMAGVTFMDSQLGKVLDTLSATGLEESTVVCFFSDHGFAMGERGQWGKRSLFESDSRVPLIFADPRYSKAHGTRTPALAELVDVFPSLTELAGLPPPHALVPPINGVSQAAVVRAGGPTSSDHQGGNTGGGGYGHVFDAVGSTSTLPRTAAVSQFSRCPITASEYLTDLSGFGPLVSDPLKVKDFRSRPHHGAIAWECNWKGWQWGNHHDLAVMGYSLRVDGWRYTAWLPWNSNATEGVWTWPPLGEELYAHESDPNEPPGLFDEVETTNLLSVDGVGKALFSGTGKEGDSSLVAGVQAKHRNKGKELFERLRRLVLEKRGVADDSFYMCDRIHNKQDRERCVKEVASEMGFDVSLKGQLASTVDSRGLQRSRLLADKIHAAVPQLPLPTSSSRKANDGLPSSLEHKLRRLAMVPDQALQFMSGQVAAFERVAKVGDIVSVGSAETRINALQQHIQSRSGKESAAAAAAAASWGGVRYKVKQVIRTPELVSAEMMTLPLPKGTYGASFSQSEIGQPVDLVLEMLPEKDGSANVVCASDAQALGLGYLPHVATVKLRSLKPNAKRELPTFEDRAQWKARSDASSAFSSGKSGSSCLPPYMGPYFTPDGVSATVLPKELYVASRAPALSPDASWADRTEVIHWLPEDLHEYDKRLGLDSSSSSSSESPDVGTSVQDFEPVAKAGAASLSKNDVASAAAAPVPTSAIETEIAAKVKDLTRCVVLDPTPKLPYLDPVELDHKGNPKKAKKGDDKGGFAIAGRAMQGLLPGAHTSPLQYDPTATPSTTSGSSAKTAAAAEEATTVTSDLSSSSSSACVVPHVEVSHKKVRVHMVPVDTPPAGIRFTHLVTQGLAKHPAVVLVDSLNHDGSNADLVLYLSTSTKRPPLKAVMETYARENALRTSNASGTATSADVTHAVDKAVSAALKGALSSDAAKQKLVVLDEGDGPGFFPPVGTNFLAYFKRSWPLRKDGKYAGPAKRHARNYWPMAYSVSDDYTAPLFGHLHVKGHGDTLRLAPADLRQYDVSCTLRVHPTQPARTRVASWVTKAVEQWKLSVSGGIIGEVNTGQRKEINKGYFSTLGQAKIIVTCNPSNWEGDFRLWEAMSTGALVFVDEMHTPLPHPFLDGVHLVVYDNSDKGNFLAKLKFYLDNPADLRRVAYQGFLHAMAYHRSVTRMDWILRSCLDAQRRDVPEADDAESFAGEEEASNDDRSFTAVGHSLKHFTKTEGSLAIRPEALHSRRREAL